MAEFITPNSPENQTLEAEQHHITLIGEGNVVLDGGVHNHLLEKPPKQLW